jgi:diguanylate cyclase (GGDEF)-like protein
MSLYAQLASLTDTTPDLDAKVEAALHAHASEATRLVQAVALAPLGGKRNLEVGDLLPFCGLAVMKDCALLLSDPPAPQPALAAIVAWLAASRAGLKNPSEPTVLAAREGREPSRADAGMTAELRQHATISLAPPLDGDRTSMVAQVVALGHAVAAQGGANAAQEAELYQRAARVGLEPAIFRAMLADVATLSAEWAKALGPVAPLVWQPANESPTDVIATELARVYKYLLGNATADAETGLPNRRYAHARLETEWAAARRRGGQLSVVDIETDRAGMAVPVAKALRETARMQDVVCRVGEERFLIICTDTGAPEVAKAAERLCGTIGRQGHRTPTGDVTLSLGVAAMDSTISSVQEFLRRADDALRAARAAGGNRFVAWRNGDAA